MPTGSITWSQWLQRYASECHDNILMSYREIYFPEEGYRVIDFCMGQILQKMSTVEFQWEDALSTQELMAVVFGYKALFRGIRWPSPPRISSQRCLPFSCPSSWVCVFTDSLCSSLVWIFEVHMWRWWLMAALSSVSIWIMMIHTYVIFSWKMCISLMLSPRSNRNFRSKMSFLEHCIFSGFLSITKYIRQFWNRG